MLKNVNVKAYLLFVLAVIAVNFATVSATAEADAIKYFGKGIDFWNKEKTKASDLKSGDDKEAPVDTATTIPANQTREVKGSQQKFNWSNQLDPENKEFFREGDYTPPEPFMELVRNPTDNNIRMWFAYMDKKNQLAQRLSQRMEEYARSNAPQIPKMDVTRIIAAAHRQPLADDEFERYRFRMYFDSQCPHCRHMFETLNELQDRGYFVEARQVDQGSLDGVQSHVAIVPAGRDEVKKYGITSVPLLLVGDLKAKKVFRQSGFITVEQLLAEMRTH